MLGHCAPQAIILDPAGIKGPAVGAVHDACLRPGVGHNRFSILLQDDHSAGGVCVNSALPSEGAEGIAAARLRRRVGSNRCLRRAETLVHAPPFEESLLGQSLAMFDNTSTV